MTVATAGEGFKDVKKLEEELQVAQTEIVNAKEKLGRLQAFGEFHDLLRTLKQLVESATPVLAAANKKVHKVQTDYQRLEDQVKLCKQAIIDSTAFNDKLGTNRSLRQAQKDYRGTVFTGSVRRSDSPHQPASKRFRRSPSPRPRDRSPRRASIDHRHRHRPSDSRDPPSERRPPPAATSSRHVPVPTPTESKLTQITDTLQGFQQILAPLAQRVAALEKPEKQPSPASTSKSAEYAVSSGQTPAA